MVVAGQELGSKPRIGCFAHCLNLAAQKALKIAAVARVLGRVRRIVSFFHRSTTASALLKSKIKLMGLPERKLIQDVSTRWNSAADMLERYLLLQPAIYTTLVAKEVNTKDSEITTLNEIDTRMAEDIMECLLPLRAMTNAICTEQTPTVSIILPLIKKTEKLMSPSDTGSSIKAKVKEAVTNNLSIRYTGQEIQDFLEECTVLDPRFKDSYFEADLLAQIYQRITVLASAGQLKTEPDQTVPATLPETLQIPVAPQLPVMDVDESLGLASTSQSETDETQLPEVPAKTGLAAIFDDVAVIKHERGNRTLLERAMDEVSRYKDIGQISVDCDPMMWWSDNCSFYPLIAQLVKKRLCIPATSVPSERVFSTAGDIVSAQRASTSPETVDALIFLKKNSSK